MSARWCEDMREQIVCGGGGRGRDDSRQFLRVPMALSLNKKVRIQAAPLVRVRAAPAPYLHCNACQRSYGDECQGKFGG